MEAVTPTPMTTLLSSRSLSTSGVKSLSPVPMTNVDTYSRSKHSSMASTASLMSAAFLRTAPIRWGISISSTWLRASERPSSAKLVQSA